MKIGHVVGIALLVGASLQEASGQQVAENIEHNLNYTASVGGKTAEIQVNFFPPKAGEPSYRVEMFGLDVSSGAPSDTEIVSSFDPKDSWLISAITRDAKTGRPETEFKRTIDDCLFSGGSDDFCYVFVDFGVSAGDETITQPFFEYVPVDFLTVLAIASNYYASGEKNDVNLSLLLDETLKHVVMRRTKNEKEVELFKPDINSVGIRYIFEQSQSGKFYPKTISLRTSAGSVDLEGTPR